MGLVGYWSFNEGTSTKALDYSGKGNTGTLSGSPLPTWAPGKFGSSISINGVNNSYVTSAADMPITGDAALTISGWFYFRSATAAGVLGWGNISGAGQAVGFYWGAQGSRILSVEYAGSNPAYVNSALQLNTWYHFVYTKSPGAINTTSTFYVNGANFGSVSGSAATPNIASGKMLIGAWARSDQGGADVLIDDVRVYNRALSAAEVSALYSSGAQFGATKLTQGPSNNSLLGYWKLDEGTSTIALDSSGNGRRGTLQNSPTRVSGKLGGALNFNGSTQYVSIGDINVGTRYSIGAWLYPTAWPVSGDAYIHNAFCDEAPANNTTFCFRLGSQGLLSLRQRCALAAYITTGANDLESATDLQLNRWTHCMVTVDNSAATKTVKFYINGVLDRTQTYTGTVANGTAGFQIGSSPDANRFFEGRIDEVRFYNRLLTDTEVAAIYQAGTQKVHASSADLTKGSSLASGLVGHWTFDGADTVTTIADKSGQGNSAYVGSGGPATSTMKTIGKLGQALVFNGTNAYLTFNDSPMPSGSSPRTISMWFKTTTTGAHRAMIHYGTGGSTQEIFFYVNAGKLNVDCWGSNWDATTSVNDGKWHLGTFTYDGTTTRIYRDGVLDGTNAQTCSTTLTNSTTNAFIGKDTFNRYFPGQLDDVRIYNRALSASEVKQLYNLGK